MKIKTSVFKDKNNENLIKMLRNKEEGVNGGMYFDFNDSYVYLSGQSIKARVPFEYELSEGEKLPLNFYIDSVKFLTLVEAFDELNYERETFFVGNEKFKVEILEADNEISDIFDYNDFTDKVKVDSDFLNKVKKADKYIISDAEANPTFKTLFVNDNVLFTIAYNELFQTTVENVDDMKVSYDTLKIITILKEDSTMLYSEQFLKVVKNGIEVIIPNNVSVEAPPVLSEDFIDGYNHDTYFTIKKAKILPILKFLDVYYSDSMNKTAIIKLKYNKTDSIMEISSTTEKDQIVRNLEDVESNLDEIEFYVDATKLRNAIETIDDLTIKIKWTADKYALCIEGMENKDCSVVFSYMQYQ